MRSCTPRRWVGRRGGAGPRWWSWLLERGAKTNQPDDLPWATPLAWAREKGHAEIEEMLKEAGGRKLSAQISYRTGSLAESE